MQCCDLFTGLVVGKCVTCDALPVWSELAYTDTLDKSTLDSRRAKEARTAAQNDATQPKRRQMMA